MTRKQKARTMPTEGLTRVLATRLDEMAQSGRLKGAESPIRGVVPARDGRGPRYLIEGEGATEFLRMNSNGYLGMARRPGIGAARGQAGGARRDGRGRGGGAGRPAHRGRAVTDYPADGAPRPGLWRGAWVRSAAGPPPFCFPRPMR